MATNGLSTTFGGVEGEGWIKGTLAAASAKITLPDQFNEECFIEAIVNQGGVYLHSTFYNPGSTTVPVRLRPGGISTAAATGGTTDPALTPALSTGTINANHTLYLHKDATSGKCDIRQTSSATLTSATVWVRKIG